MDRTRTISTLFEQQVRIDPDRAALRHHGTSVTYGQLNARANRIARFLRRRGVTPGAHVGIWGVRSIDLVATLLALAKVGATYVPIDPAAPTTRLAETLATAEASLLVVPARQPDADTALAGFQGPRLMLDECDDAIAREAPENLDLPLDPERVWAVLFTSGTTGVPKGILMRVGGVTELVTGMGEQFPFATGDAFLLHRSCTIVGSIWEYFGPLVHGARGVILSGDDARDPATIWQRLLDDRVTHLIVSPTLADALCRHGQRYHLASHTMRHAIIGGEPVSRRTIAAWRRVFPTGQTLICYGITESMYIAFFDVDGLDPREPDDLPVPVGRPFRKATVRIVDDTMDDVAPGVVGEVCVSSPCLAHGYLKAPRLTAERFVADPWAGQPRGVLYRTGDMGCWRADGLLELKGRRDRQVKIKGFRVELDDVEAAVRRVPQVRNAAVAIDRDARQQPRLVAYVEADPPLSADDLRRALRPLVPDYMVPAVFVHVPAIPITPGGKIDRRALEAVAAGRPA